jgi:branched-chain amino acid transport system permease protein
MSAIAGWFGDNLVNIVNGVALGMLFYTIAIGLSLVFGMLGLLNLAHGTVFLLGAYLGATLIDLRGSAGLVLAALVCAAAAGVVVGGGLTLMSRPLVGRGHMDEALLTLGIALAGGSLMTTAFGGDPFSVAPPSFLRGSVSLVGHGYPVYRVVLIGVGLLMAVVVDLVFERTTAGALIRAIVADRDMVRAIGVDVRKVLVAVFAAGAALAAVGGVLGGPILGAAPGLDGQVLLIALVVVVVGGLGSPRGAFLGAMLIGLLQSLGTALIPRAAPFLIFGAMAVVLIVRPSGLLGKGTASA